MASQLGMAYVYPVYAYGFTRLTGVLQAAFALLLPVIKLASEGLLATSCASKKTPNPSSCFTMLFVATCLQNSMSTSTLVMVTAVDFAVACVSVWKVNAILRTLHESIESARFVTSQSAPAVHGAATLNSSPHPPSCQRGPSTNNF
uniref:Uncharacterized protein n=1 Tax=Globisporangium ultimum (strain ATCC 200006 / CBS 805.95 / DAOM BR144) TaxID=431595 RepID=K3X4D7_GLOUD